MKFLLPASAFERRLFASFAAGAVAWLMLAGLTWHFSLAGIDATRFVIHSHQVIASLGRVQQFVYLAESEQRGLLIAADRAYLRGYREALDNLAKEQVILSGLVADDPSQSARARHMQMMIASRIDWLERNVKLVEARPFQRMQVDVSAGTGLDRQIDMVATDMFNEEQHLLKHRQKLEAARAQMSATGFFALLLLVLLAVPFLYARLRKAFDEKHDVAEEARHLVDVIDRTPDMIAISTPAGDVAYINRAMRELLGIGNLPAAAVKREQVYEPASLNMVLRTGIPHAIAHGSWSGETRWLNASGKEVPVSQVLIAHRQSDGSITLSTIARDISATKEAERVLEEKNRQIEQGSRMKTEFMATMSHELRTPLNAIIGFSSVIRDGLAGRVDATVKEYANDILDSGRHLLELINDILDLSTIESGNLRLEAGMVDGNDLAASGMTIMREQASARGIRMLQVISPEIRGLWLDPRKTRQIIFNLLSNAVKFTPDNGEVRLGMRLVPRSLVAAQQTRDGTRLFALQPSSFLEFLEITVSDNGVGIVQADLYRLFQPFTQLDASRSRSYEGTGLGLVLVRRLVELQAGAMLVESAPDKGSRFTVWLPLRDPEPTDQLPIALPDPLLRPMPH
jgi:PAS domain S-box-containing protein